MPSSTVITWVPRQHGAWAMLIAPGVTGLIVGGFSWRGPVTLVAWLVAFGAYASLGQMLKVPPARRARWWPPLVVYGTAAVVLAGVVVVSAPALLRWAPCFVVLFGTSLVCQLRRAERSWLNDLVTQLAAGLMTVIVAGLPPVGSPPSGWLPPGADNATAWRAAGMVFAYFFGTVFYVKTMLRERGRASTYAASLAYHALIAAAGWWLGPLAGAVGLVLLARAALVPRAWPRAQAKTIGLGEFAATVVVVAATVLTV